MRSVLAAPVLALAALVLACDGAKVALPPETEDERTSYAIGLHLGLRLREMDAGLDPDRILAGFEAGVSEGAAAAAAVEPAPSAAEIAAELARLAEVTRERREASRRRAAERNARASAAFLAENRTQAGVVELPSGIQYRVVAEGGEPPPSLDDRLTVEYEGRLLDGAVFDTSKDRFAPTIVRLRRAPKAWQEVLPRVPAGSRVEIWVPGLPDASDPAVGLVGPGELVVFTLHVAVMDRHPSAKLVRAPPP